MVRICDIYDVIDRAAPFANALSFDNSGLLVGDPTAEVARALLALDITPEVVEEAASINAGLIISHHPVIFEPIKSLNSRGVPYLLARKGIAALCCHTNLDISPVCGVNIALAGRLGLKSIRQEDVFGEDCVLFSGEIEGSPLPADFAKLVQERLDTPSVQLIPGNRPIKKVFLCSGAGGSTVPFAACRGADAYVTGEMKHHEMLAAAATGVTCVVAGHYETEIVFAEFLAAYLRKRLPGAAFLLSKTTAAHQWITK